jgi:hypothetical protein
MPLVEHNRWFYLRWDDRLRTERPYQLVSEDVLELHGMSQQNFNILAKEVQIIRDICEKGFTFTLDDKGFMFLKHDLEPLDMEKQDQVERR